MNRVKLDLCLLWIGWIFVSIKIWKQISIVSGSLDLFLPVPIKIMFQNFSTSLLIDSNEILISKSIGFSYFSKIKHSSSFFDFLSFLSNFQESTFSKVWNFVLKATNFISKLNGSKHNFRKFHKNHF